MKSASIYQVDMTINPGSLWSVIGTIFDPRRNKGVKIISLAPMSVAS